MGYCGGGGWCVDGFLILRWTETPALSFGNTQEQSPGRTKTWAACAWVPLLASLLLWEGGVKQKGVPQAGLRDCQCPRAAGSVAAGVWARAACAALSAGRELPVCSRREILRRSEGRTGERPSRFGQRRGFQSLRKEQKGKTGLAAQCQGTRMRRGPGCLSAEQGRLLSSVTGGLVCEVAPVSDLRQLPGKSKFLPGPAAGSEAVTKCWLAPSLPGGAQGSPGALSEAHRSYSDVHFKPQCTGWFSHKTCVQRTSQGNAKSLHVYLLPVLWLQPLAGWGLGGLGGHEHFLLMVLIYPEGQEAQGAWLGPLPQPGQAYNSHTLASWLPGALVVKPQFQPVPAAPSPRPWGFGGRGATAFLQTTSPPVSCLEVGGGLSGICEPGRGVLIPPTPPRKVG